MDHDPSDCVPEIPTTDRKTMKTQLLAFMVWPNDAALRAGGAADHSLHQGANIDEVHLTLGEGADKETVLRWVCVAQDADAKAPVGRVVLIYQGADCLRKSAFSKEVIERTNALAEVPSRLVVGNENLTFWEFIAGIWSGHEPMTVVFHRKSSPTATGKGGGK
jgi:hypothetical protein